MTSIKGLYYLQNYINIYKQNPNNVYEIELLESTIKCSDIEKILQFPNIEKIYLSYTEHNFINEFTKHINCFDNLYDIFINTGNSSLYKFQIDNDNLIYVSGIFDCINGCISKEEKCYYCDNLNKLKNTKSKTCIIENIGNYNLLNNLSISIENLKIKIGWSDLKNFELLNIPILIKNLTIIYDNFTSPEKIYEKCKDKIKLPFNCKLKIIQRKDLTGKNNNRFFSK